MSAGSVARGGTADFLDVRFSAAGQAVDPVNPLADIIDPLAVQVVTDAVPIRLSVGHFKYLFSPALTAPLGTWSIHWTGTINGAFVEGSETFTVVEAGTVIFDGIDTSICAPWVTEADIAAIGCCTGLSVDYDWAHDITVASEVLYVLSGRQFTGACTRTVRPCEVVCGCGCHIAGWPLWSWGLTLYDASVLSPRCCPLQVDLGGKVASVGSVKIDGTTLATSAYRLDEGRWLVRLVDADGNNEGWPCCQRLDLPSTEDCTFEITYTTESDVPEMGKRAAAELACELAKACNPTAGECRLPKRMTSLTRQGVTMTLLDPQDFLDQGRTGLYFVDLFLKAVNPNGLRSAPRVLSPDIIPHRRIG